MEIPLNICFYGVGGLGGYFGGLITSLQKDDINTFFIARGEHLDEIRKNGLILNTAEKTLVCRPVLATDNIKDIPHPDMVFIGVKSYDLEKACVSIRGIISSSTVIIPLLNGVNIYSGIRNILKEPVILPACVFLNGYISSPGVVNHQTGNLIILGKDPQNRDYDPDRLLSLFDEAGIKRRWYDDPQPAIWRKYIFIAPYSLVTACYELPFGGINENNEYTNLAAGIMKEIKGIADRMGIDLPSDIIEETLKYASGVPYETRTSYQRDIEAGKQSEDDIYAETIIRLGKELGVQTLVTEMIFNKIKERKL